MKGRYLTAWSAVVPPSPSEERKRFRCCFLPARSCQQSATWHYVLYFLLNWFVLGASPVAGILLFSGIGEGAAVYVWLHKWRHLKVVFGGIGLVLLLVLYLGDLCLSREEAGRGLGPPALLPTLPAKLLCGLACLSLMLASLLFVDAYPSAPLLLVQLLLFALLSLLTVSGPRLGASGLLPEDQRDVFSTAQASALGLHGLWASSAWLLWVADAPLGGGYNGWNEGTRARLRGVGVTRELFGDSVELVMLYLWLSPAINVMCLCVATAIVMGVGSLQRRLRTMPKSAGSTDTAEGSDALLSKAEQKQVATVTFAVKLLTGAVVTVVGCLWVTASVVGASLSLASTVQAFTVALACFLAAYVFLALSAETRAVIARGALASPLMRTARLCLESNWSRALLLACVSGALPGYLLLSLLNQRARALRALAARGPRPSGWLTARAQQQLQSVSRWEWTDIHKKLQQLCMLAVALFALGGVGTNIFLAWVNSKLQNTGFFPLCVVFFLVGIGMFMIPIVPGVAVYLFGGVLIPAAYVQQHGLPGVYAGEEFWIGFAISAGLSFSLKMLAIVLQQKGIGEPMSTNLTVLLTVGANTPQMKAVERILRQPGFSWPKIVILCGGPDWPTSVLTGILRLSLPQMLLCSTPVALNVLFVTAAGSFRLRAAESATWSALSSVALTLASAWTVLQMALAAYYIQDTWERCHTFLSQPRREHAQLDWLDHVTCQQRRFKDERAAWHRLPMLVRVSVLLSTAGMLISSFWMVMLQSSCWDNFEVTDDIASLGLHFIRTEGWVAIGIFGVACCLHVIVALWVGCETRSGCRALAQTLEPGREAWVALRLQECPQEDAASAGEDLHMAVLQLRQELRELRLRVSELEGHGSKTPSHILVQPRAAPAEESSRTA